MVAAWFTVLLAAGTFAVELAASGRRADFFRVLSWMALVHAVIGMGEAIITGLVIRFILITRPDLIEPGPASPRVPSGLAEGAGGLIGADARGAGRSLAVAVFLSPFASQFPDGLEFVGEKLGFLTEATSSLQSPPRCPTTSFRSRPGHVKAATAVAGLVGTLVVFALSWSLARVFAGAGGRALPERVTADAA